MSRYSCDLIQAQQDLGRQTRSAADEKAPHHPLKFRRRGFETRRGAKINEVWIDGLAAHQLLDRVCRPVPQATINDVDEGPARRLKHVFGFELHHTVSAQ